MLTMDPRMVNIIWSWSPISFKHTVPFLVSVFGTTPNHTSLEYRCPWFRGIGLILVYLTGETEFFCYCVRRISTVALNVLSIA